MVIQAQSTNASLQKNLVVYSMVVSRLNVIHIYWLYVQVYLRFDTDTPSRLLAVIHYHMTHQLTNLPPDDILIHFSSHPIRWFSTRMTHCSLYLGNPT